MMVDASVEAEFLDHEAALVRPARDPDRAASLDLGDLPDDRADRTRRRRDRDGFTGPRLADFREAHIGRHARHAEHAERRRDRCRRRIELAQARAVGNRVVLPAAMAQHNVADGKFGMSRRHDLADVPPTMGSPTSTGLA